MDKVLGLEKYSDIKVGELEKKNKTTARDLYMELENKLERRAKNLLRGRFYKIDVLLEKISIDLSIIKKTRDQRLDDVALTAIREHISNNQDLQQDTELTEQLTKIEKQLAQQPLKTVAETLGLDKPVKDTPEFRADVERRKVSDLVKLADVDSSRRTSVLGKIKNVNALSDKKINELQNDGKITAGESEKLKKVATFYSVLDENINLTAVAMAKVVRPNDLARMDKGDWQKIIEEEGLKESVSMPVGSYSRILEQKFKRLYPSVAFHKKVADKTGELKVDADLLNTLNPLKKANHNNKLFLQRRFYNLNVGGLQGLELEAAKRSFETVIKLDNRYKGLKIAEELNGDRRDEDDRIAEVSRRVKAADEFINENPDVFALNLSPFADDDGKKALKYPNGLRKGDKEKLFAMVRGYQRALVISEDVDKAEKIIDAGYQSSLAISSTDTEVFIRETGLNVSAAWEIKARAESIAGKVATKVGTAFDAARNDLGDTAVGNVSTQTVHSLLKDIPGYADFFGSQNYCSCRHCQSILSPAAYFVDLMCFIDEHISSVYFSSKPDHPLNLRNRRPDLWDRLELTCENTNTEIPYLVVINEVLEDAVIHDIDNTIQLNNRDVIETKIYQDTLPIKVDNFDAPLHLAFEEVKVYLEHFNISVADMAEAGLADGNALARLILGIAPKVYELITTENTDINFLRRVYQFDFIVTGGSIDEFEPQAILGKVGVNRDDLGEIVTTSFFLRNGGDVVQIFSEKRDPIESVQNDIELIKNLTPKLLDRIHRFVRLWRITGWRIGELDLLIISLVDKGIGSINIDSDLVKALAEIHRLQSKQVQLGAEISVEQLAALFYLIPTQAVIKNLPGAATDPKEPFKYPSDTSTLAKLKTPLLNRLFANQNFLDDIANSNVQFLHPAFSAASVVDPNLSTLLGGISVDEDQLYQLIRGLAQPLGLDLTTANEDDKQFQLTQRNLTLLFRHALLARILKLSIQELFALIILCEDIAASYISSITEINALFRFCTRWRATSWTAQDLLFISGINNSFFTELLPASEEQPADLAAQLVQELAEAGLPENADSAEILNALLPAKTGIETSNLPAFLAMLGDNLGNAVYLDELKGINNPDNITALILKLKKLAKAFSDKNIFTAETLDFIRINKNAFGINGFSALNSENLFYLNTYLVIAKEVIANDALLDKFNKVLLSFDAAESRPFKAAEQYLAEILDIDLALIKSLQQSLGLSAKPVQALEQLINAILLVKHLGIGGNALVAIQSLNYFDIASVAEAVKAAFRAKYKSEQSWREAIEPYNLKLLSRRRDGLVTYLISSLKPQVFKDSNDLYHYFLFDVKVEGVVATSRIAAAIDSIQLYVHRVRSDNEESEVGAAVPVHVLPQSVPDEEWLFRKNYRVWEANRKIFLFPENFIEPELRDNKTELFRQLEEELLSNQIDQQSMFEAYSRYLKGFDEMCRLRIAGSFHEKDKKLGRDVLHLFGATSDNPPIYYYRRVENFHYGFKNDEVAIKWGSWEKAEIQVPVKQVSPIVFKGQLYVFWVRYTAKPLNSIKTGSSRFDGYQHRAHVEFSKRNLDGSWTQPQPIALSESPFQDTGDGIILDPLIPKNSYKLKIPVYGDIEIYKDKQPLYDNRYHIRPKDDYSLKGFGWDRVYPSTGSEVILRGMDFRMWSKVDLFRRKIGPQIDFSDTFSGTDYVPIQSPLPWIEPGLFEFIICLVAVFAGREAANELKDSMLKRYFWSKKEGGLRELHVVNGVARLLDGYSMAAMLLEKEHFERYKKNMGAGDYAYPWLPEEVTEEFDPLFQEDLILSTAHDANYDVVNGSQSDVVIQTARDVFHIGFNSVDDKSFVLRRLNTSVSEEMSELLFTQGLDTFLSTQKQLAINEGNTGINIIDPNRIFDATEVSKMDYDGPMGIYFREIYFHVPFLLADHLNTQGQYEEAELWYRYIFDYTSTEVITGIDPALSEHEKKCRLLDRVWRYREFRKLDAETLRARLTNDAAIEEYRTNPFNPHAIARLRLTAYQKSVVMKYIDNLIDWGDHLFIKAYNTSNPEYLREATLKYITAQDLLGDRAVDVGDCGEGYLSPKTFANIKQNIQINSEFLMELESAVSVKIPTPMAPHRSRDGHTSIYDELFGRGYSVRKSLSEALRRPITDEEIERLRKLKPDQMKALAKRLRISVEDLRHWIEFLLAEDDDLKAGTKKAKHNTKSKATDLEVKRKGMSSFTVSTVTQINPLFCVPANAKLASYWNLVDDRLYKIRNSLDVNGVFRRLPLFAAPIDPALLANARAAGLSMDDILESVGNLSLYRFRYLVEKAKTYAQTVQNFDNALYSALEKRDAEELVNIKNAHERNILKMTAELRKKDVDLAEQNIRISQQRKDNAQYRLDYYNELISTGLTPAEITKTTAIITGVVAKATSLGLQIGAGVAHLVPEVGSPLAMKYGGKQLGNSLSAWSRVANMVGQSAELTSTIAGMVADYERRDQGWKHQKKLAEKDVKVLEKEIKVAELRHAVSEQSLDIHNKNSAQQAEVMDFYKNKFTNFALFTHLARTLQHLHRESYDNALAIAKLAEQAYHFERPGDNTIYIGGEWDATRSGLHAGGRLIQNLQSMERRYIETHQRHDEIHQSFSLAQLQPEALIELKQTASCEFSISEFFFDLFYPGQYRRRIRSVQLTIPCITGPYTNVGAKLRLIKSYMRNEPALGDTHLIEVLPRQQSSIATSRAQSDAGVFELSFSGENYMPFEGEGAVSDWRLELPSQLKYFDYNTINDVVVTISYVAEEDQVFRDEVESNGVAVMNSLNHYLQHNSLQKVYSLRQDFSSELHRLMHSPENTPVTLDFTERHFPLYFSGKVIKITKAQLMLDIAATVDLASIDIGFDSGGAVAAGALPVFSRDPNNVSNLPVRNMPVGGYSNGQIIGSHEIVVYDAGALAPNNPLPGDISSIDKDKLKDILLVLEYSSA